MKHTVIYTLPIILILFSCDPSLPYKEMYYDAMDEIIELKDQIEQLEEEKEHKINEINNFGINLKRATSRDYSKWLNGYLSIDGNKCTHNYNYPLPNGEFYIATEDFEFKKPLYGASSIYLTLPPMNEVGFLGKA